MLTGCRTTHRKFRRVHNRVEGMLLSGELSTCRIYTHGIHSFSTAYPPGYTHITKKPGAWPGFWSGCKPESYGEVRLNF